MKLVVLHRALRLIGLLALALLPVGAMADTPIASSNFVGVEDPLSENGAWAALTSLSPNGVRFQKNNMAYPDLFISHNHAGARTTAAIPADHYSEILIGHVAGNTNNLGPIVRVQPSGSAIDSHYLWWGSGTGSTVNYLYRVDANGISYTASPILQTSPVADGDRLRLIARGLVIYGIHNGAREFIYNTGPDTTKYATGTAGMLAYPSGPTLTDVTIASWSSGAAPVSSGGWASSNFSGVENPLDEGDRWYPLPGYSGFRKAGGLAIGRDWGQNVSGVWSITPPAKQYSEVTLGTVVSGGGGPIVRIDRNSAGQTGWLLFLWADNPTWSGIYKLTSAGITAVSLFTPTIIPGDRWRLTADGNTLTVSRNGLSQFTYTTDGSYPAGDVGIESLTSAFTFKAWEGGDTAGPADTTPPTAPGNLTALATSGSQISLMWTAASDDVGVSGYLLERCQGAGCMNFAQVATVTDIRFNDTGLAANTTYSYRVRATDAAGNLGPYSNTASATTLAF
jgi:chitodextrinase